MQPVSIIDLTHRVIARLIRRGALVNSHAEFRRVDNAQSWPRERETSASTDAFHRPVVPSFLAPRQHVENVDKSEAIRTLDLRASDFDAVAELNDVDRALERAGHLLRVER